MTRLRAVFVPLLVSVTLHAQAPQQLTPERKMDAFTQQFRLEAAEQPWHMKVQLRFYDVQGDMASAGTLEEWYSPSPRQIKRVVTTPTTHQTEIVSADGTFREGDQSLPDSIDLVWSTLLHPQPTQFDLVGTTLQREFRPFGKTQLDCIMIAGEIPKTKHVPLGLFPTYCFELDKPVLQAAYFFGNISAAINNTGMFLENQVPTHFSLFEDAKKMVDSDVQELVTLAKVDEAIFKVPTDAKKIDTAVTPVDGAAMVGHVQHKEEPVYPASARAAHLSGDVVLRAIVGKDGRIHRLRVVRSPDAGMAISSILSVRRWTYQPYLVNGQPVDVDTTIKVHFTYSEF